MQLSTNTPSTNINNSQAQFPLPTQQLYSNPFSNNVIQIANGQLQTRQDPLLTDWSKYRIEDLLVLDMF